MAEQWEVCLVNRVYTPPQEDSGHDVWYEAKVVSPSGAKVFTKSDIASDAVDKHGRFLPGMEAVVADAYSSVVAQLLADGWEPLERQFFRRRV